MTTDIDAIIAAAVTTPADPAQSPETPADDKNATPEPQATEGDTKQPEGDKPERGEDVKDPWPKSARNAVNRRNSENRKLRAKLEMYERAEAERRAAAEKNKPAALNEADFEGKPEEYVRELARREAQALLEKSQSEQAARNVNEVHAELEAERAAAIDENAAEAQKAYPDFMKVMDANAAQLNAMKPHVREAILEADNGAYAVYQLAKEGRLADLNAMSPAQAAMMVARYEDKALAATKLKTVSNAPAPLASAKGTAPGGKSPDDMSYAELKAKYLQA